MTRLFGLIAIVMAAGCGSDSARPQGALGGACFANGTCNQGLTCETGTCETALIDAPMGHDAAHDAAPDAPLVHHDAGNSDAHLDGGLGVDASLVDGHPGDGHPGDGGVLVDASPGDGGLVVDASPGDGGVVCDELTQTGCAPSEKCTWIHDEVTPIALGHTGCVPNGTVATGATCSFGAPGPTGFDNCVRGDLCTGGTCETICDPNNGPQCTGAFACATYGGIFGDPIVAGVCDPTCDPLTQVSAAGSNCGSTMTPPERGCFGFPHPNTTWSCATNVNPTLTHRSACTSANGCQSLDGQVYINGCAAGYEPLLTETTASTQIDCVALCSPSSTYVGHATNKLGLAPYRCNSTDHAGTFAATERCNFTWPLEYDFNDVLQLSPTGDKVGYCRDFSQYTYTDINGTEKPWPDCATLPLTVGDGDPNGVETANDWGCTRHDNTLLKVARPRNPYLSELRFPYMHR